MGLKREYVEEFRRSLQAARATHAELAQQRSDWIAAAEEVVPAFRAFERVLLGSGDIAAAIATGALQQLRDAGYLRTSTEFLTEQRLRNKAHAWTLEWLGPKVVDVARDPTGGPTVGDCWQRVELHVQIDKGNRRVDTEFYGLNPTAGETANPFDDREKLHVVWEVPEESGAPLRLYYLGVGANSPYKLDHPDRPGLDARGMGKPRFYVYGRDRTPAVHFRHEVTRRDEGPVLWPWPHLPVERVDDAYVVRFVRTTDDTRTCLADPAVIAANAGRSLDDVVRAFFATIGEAGSAPTFDALPPALQSKIRSSFIVEAATVRRIEGPLPATLPTLEKVLEWLRFDYAAYFYATAAATTRPRTEEELLDATRWGLDAHRRANYQRIFERPTREVFDPEDLPHLPATVGDLFRARPPAMPPTLATLVNGMRAQLRSELEADLYHFGQYPNDRVQHLRLGVHLALSAGWGDVYCKVVNQARRCVEGQEPFGEFDLRWP